MGRALITIEDVDRELGATADYANPVDVDKARRRHAAITRRIDFAEEAKSNGESHRYPVEAWERQLGLLNAFIASNATQTEAEKLANPSVTHADFSTFGRYA